MQCLQHQSTENDLFVHPVSLNISPENPLIAITRIFNHLPREIKQIEDEKLFAGTLKKVLSEHNLDDIHEFLLHKL